jgi:hypothetical protein
MDASKIVNEIRHGIQNGRVMVDAKVLAENLNSIDSVAKYTGELRTPVASIARHQPPVTCGIFSTLMTRTNHLWSRVVLILEHSSVHHAKSI